MHQELSHFQLPNFLAHLFQIKQVTIYSYAFLITFGCLVATVYTKRVARKELGIEYLSNNFFYLIFIAGFVGGKLFFYLEKPIFYYNNPSLLLDNFSGGFVFYGSFVTIIPVIIWYLKNRKIPVLPMLDILAITTLIVHSLGRLGCFLGGCCYGAPTNSVLGVVFPKSNSIKVHPTQLYESFILVMLLVFLLFIKKHKKFNGQIFLLYLVLYAVSRSILELFRGDARGYLIKDILSHSQFMALLILFTTLFIYNKLNTLNKLTLNS